MKKPGNQFVTRAVVIGISDYEDPDIPDLKYAHKDALAFKNYLSTSYDKGIKEENIKLLTNENATGANIHKSLYWLVKESTEGDKCILYFSGHGDVETIYEDEPGHFLVYDSPSSIYQINSLRLDDLKRIINTLTIKKGVKVTLFSDACRSGKLAGSSINGPQATAAALSTQFAKEVKIMSCQANEYSIEGEQWGDGRGMFSYHLIEGLIGMADTDNDLMVNLKEIQRYLEDRFEEDLKNENQSPVSIGDKNSRVSYVDAVALENIKSSKQPLSGSIASVTTKSSNINQNQNDIVQLFYNAIQNNYLLEQYTAIGDDKGKSAEFYFELIQSDATLKEKEPILKGDFIAALQNDAQRAINEYLELDKNEMLKRWYGDVSQYEVYPKYLEKAADLLGEMHYMFSQVKAKQLYFQSVSNRIKLEREKAKPDAFSELLSMLNEALLYQPRSPYILNEKGLLLLRSKQWDKAQPIFIQAKEMSPTWAMPYNNLSYTLIKKGEYDKAIEYALQAKELNPNIQSPYRNLSDAYYKKNDMVKSIENDLQILELNPSLCKIYNNIAYKYSKASENEKAFSFYDQCISCDKSYTRAYINKSILLNDDNKFKEAIDVLMAYDNTGNKSEKIYNQIGSLYEKNNDHAKAESYYLLAVDVNPNYIAKRNLGELYNKINKFQIAEVHLKSYIEFNPEDNHASFQLAVAYAGLLKLNDFKKEMLKLLESGYLNKEKMEESEILSSIKETPEYSDVYMRL